MNKCINVMSDLGTNLRKSCSYKFHINWRCFSEHTKQSKRWGFSIYLVRMKLWVQSPGPRKPGRVVHACTLCESSPKHRRLDLKGKNAEFIDIFRTARTFKSSLGWRDGLAVKSTCCSCRKLSSHTMAHNHRLSPVPTLLMPSSELTHTHSEQTYVQPKLSNTNK